MSMMKRYVVGFAFDAELQHVLLINKLRPDWQRGKLNGVGGLIEPIEISIEAMSREFKEETGIEQKTNDWNLFCILIDKRYWAIDFYYSVGLDITSYSLISEEIPVAVNLLNLDEINCISNLRFLIPMAINCIKKVKEDESIELFKIEEL